MMRTLVVGVALLAACKKTESKTEPTKAPPVAPVVSDGKPGSPIARGTIRSKKVETAYAVIAGAGAKVADLEKLARTKAPSLEVTASTLADTYDAEQLTFLLRGLEPSEAAAVRAAPGLVVLRGSSDKPVELAREITAAARDVAGEARGWVVDLETVEIFNASAFRERVVTDKLDPRKHIIVHAVSGDNEMPFLASVGLRRYGLPNLYFPRSSPSHMNAITHLMNGAAQVLLDGGDVNERGEIAIDFRALGWDVGIIEKGTGKAVWKTRWAKENPNDPDEEMVIELVPPAGEGPVGAAKLIAECFGSEPDEVVNATDDDPELIAAAGRARADLVKLRPHFAKGIPVGEELVVKARFEGADGAVEWMWVNVVSFKGTTFEGVLANEPKLIPALANGMSVKVSMDEIGDYLHEKPGAERAGGYSIEILMKRHGQ